MTEQEWMEFDEPDIRLLVSFLSPRRQRLLAAAACRVLGEWINYPAAHAALDVVETFADTGKTKAALRRARQSVVATRNELYNLPPVVAGGVELALFVVQVAASENAVSGTIPQALQALVIGEGIPEETALRSDVCPVS